MGGYVLLKDTEGREKTSKTLFSRVKLFGERQQVYNVQRGEIIQAIPISERSGNPPHNYQYSIGDKTITLYASVEHVSPLLNDKYIDLLKGIGQPSDRHHVFSIGGFLEWGSNHLEVGNTASVFVKDTATGGGQNLVTAEVVIRYVGRVDDEPGIKFGVEITDKTVRGCLGYCHGDYKGKEYFRCPVNSGLFVGLDKFSFSHHNPKVSKSFPLEFKQPKTASTVQLQGASVTRTQSRFKVGDRVVAFSDGPEVAVHGTVRWSENSNIGIETDKVVPRSLFRASISPPLFFEPKPHHGVLYLPDAFVAPSDTDVAPIESEEEPEVDEYWIVKLSNLPDDTTRAGIEIFFWGLFKHATVDSVGLTRMGTATVKVIGPTKEEMDLLERKPPKFKRMQLIFSAEFFGSTQQSDQAVHMGTEEKKKKIHQHNLADELKFDSENRSALKREELEVATKQRDDEVRKLKQQLKESAEKAEEKETLYNKEKREKGELQRQKGELQREKDILQRQLDDERQLKVQLQRRLEELNSNTNKKESLPESWIVPYREVDMTKSKPLGGGAWGTVKTGVFHGQQVAIKELHEALQYKHNIDRVHREIRTMATVRHPNLVLFIAAVLDNQAGPMIITELLDTSLRKAYEEDHFGGNANLLKIFRDVASALSYLHRHHTPIIHRDVSSANVLLEAMANSRWKAKLSDFGSANLVKHAVTAGEGAIIYTAPEAYPVHPGVKSPPKQTPKVDVYSYGALVCEVITKELPDPENLTATLAKVKKTWPQMHTIIKDCNQSRPDKRPTMADILKQLTVLI